MADCHDLFQKFHDEIKLSSSKKESLRQARDALRKKIKDYFNNEKKESLPKSWNQGSYAMATIVNPLDSGYDIDDGVYLQNLDEDKNDWPTPEIVHNWIYEAVKGHTKEDPIDKRTCVRVVYSGQYHVDLPIYGEYKNEFYLAEKGESGWHVSDPQALTDWFKKQVKQNGEQLRNIVRYLKAWTDYKSKNAKLPSGLILTILVAENYASRERNDAAFGRTIRNIYQKIADSFIVRNPIDQKEILSNRLTDTEKKNFKDLLSNLLDSANNALEDESKKEACKVWRKEFGDRFPCCDDIKEEKGEKSSIGPIYIKNPSKPWCNG
jgi:hypothetical protein